MSKNMAENIPQKPLKVLIVVGPTATGKSDVAVILAKKFNGEVISVDSRQVYRGLDIGSGKITQEEMQRVPHHLLNVADPTETYTASQFKKDADEAIKDIDLRGKLPILAGGTGFYLSALLGEVSFPEVPPNKELREVLDSQKTDVLLERLEALDPERRKTIDIHNRPRIIRAIEIAETLGSVPQEVHKTPYFACKIGLDLPDEVLKEKIYNRLTARLEEGMLNEAKRLNQEGVSLERMESLGLEYRYMARHLTGEMSKEDMIKELRNKIWQYAKRQRTWFKRDGDIQWLHPSEIKKMESFVSKFLKNH